MATHYSPRSVTDGLVLSLDAGNNKSHARNRFLAYGSGLVTENVAFAINGNGTFQRVAAGTVEQTGATITVILSKYRLVYT